MARRLGQVTPYNHFARTRPWLGPRPYHTSQRMVMEPPGYPKVVVLDDQMFQTTPRVAGIYARLCRGQGQYRGRLYTLDGAGEPEHHVGWAFFNRFKNAVTQPGYPNNLIYCFRDATNLMHLEEM